MTIPGAVVYVLNFSQKGRPDSAEMHRQIVASPGADRYDRLPLDLQEKESA